MNKPATYQTYYQTNVQTSDQLKLIIMMYDGLLRFMKKAIVKINGGEIEAAHHYITRSKNILQELISTLRIEKGGEIAQNLRELYLYSYKKLIEANLKKDPMLIQEVVQIISNLKEGWEQVRERQAQQLKQSAKLVTQPKKVSIQG
ncbi:flagellar export chaperone FliS [Deltaproteobacteria bacterium TL4]